MFKQKYDIPKLHNTKTTQYQVFIILSLGDKAQTHTCIRQFSIILNNQYLFHILKGNLTAPHIVMYNFRISLDTV